MNFSNYPLDLFTLVLGLLTLTTVAVIVRQARLSRSHKYFALSLTFLASATLGLIALYSMVFCIGVCFAFAAVCSIFYCKAWREDQRKNLPLSEGERRLFQGQEVDAYLLSDSAPRPLPGVRLIVGRRS